MTPIEVYRVLGGMLALGEFSVQELARFADVPTLLVERVLGGEGADYLTNDCGGSTPRYQLDIARRPAVVSRLHELEATERVSYSTERVKADGIPAGLAVATQILLEELPRITDSLVRERTISRARLAWEDSRHIVGSPPVSTATRAAAHDEVVSSALLLAQSELSDMPAETEIHQPVLGQLRASFTTALHAAIRAGDAWLVERLSNRYLTSPLFPFVSRSAALANKRAESTVEATTRARGATENHRKAIGSLQTLPVPTTALGGHMSGIVVDPGGNPADVVNEGTPITVRTEWNLTGSLVPLLAGTWNLSISVDEIDGPGDFNQPQMPVAVQLTGAPTYSEDIVLTSLRAGRAYALVATLTYRDAAGVPGPLGGYVNLGTVIVLPGLSPPRADSGVEKETTAQALQERFAPALASRGLPQRFHEQFEQIQRSMPDVPLAMGPDDSPEFLYEKGVILARDGEEARLVEDTVRAYFAEATGLAADHVQRESPESSRSGITRIRVGDPAHGDGRGDQAVAHALRAMREPEGRAGRRLISRNHVVSLAVNSRSGDEPVPAPLTLGTNPAPAETRYDADTAVGALVIDNGLTHDYGMVPLLAHVQGEMRNTETDIDDNLLEGVGHGTFIAGLLAAVAPNTNITVRNTLNEAGAVLESEFGERLFQAIDEHGWPDIINLSAGTSNGRTDGLLGVESFMQQLRGQRTLLVAAAGDNASATPFWPAAYASLPDYEDVVLSVGALRADGEYGSCFSNHGAWVNVYAPGERLTSTLTGFDAPMPYVYQHSSYDACRFGFAYACTCQHPRHTGALSAAGTAAKPDQVMFDGFAHWSGTSFATPVAAGMVAAYIAANKESDPRAARRQILAMHGEYAEVHGAHVPALRPPTWRPSPVASLNGHQ